MQFKNATKIASYYCSFFTYLFEKKEEEKEKCQRVIKDKNMAVLP
jgi:hypothetical protein